jgi:hypothetical protein
MCYDSWRIGRNLIHKVAPRCDTRFRYAVRSSLFDIVLIIKHQDPKTPVPQSYGSSPEIDYFRAPIQRRQQASRWKEDWEELELLVGVVYRWK